MQLPIRLSLVGATLAAIVLALAISASAASSPLKITNCTKATSRPKTVTLTCADANTLLGAPELVELRRAPRPRPRARSK